MTQTTTKPSTARKKVDKTSKLVTGVPQNEAQYQQNAISLLCHRKWCRAAVEAWQWVMRGDVA